MAKHCLDNQHDDDKVTGKLIHPCSKGSFMNRAEEVETIVAFKVVGGNLFSDLNATFVTSITRFIYDFKSPNAPNLPAT